MHSVTIDHRAKTIRCPAKGITVHAMPSLHNPKAHGAQTTSSDVTHGTGDGSNAATGHVLMPEIGLAPKTSHAGRNSGAGLRWHAETQCED